MIYLSIDTDRINEDEYRKIIGMDNWNLYQLPANLAYQSIITRDPSCHNLYPNVFTNACFKFKIEVSKLCFLAHHYVPIEQTITNFNPGMCVRCIEANGEMYGTLASHIVGFHNNINPIKLCCNHFGILKNDVETKTCGVVVRYLFAKDKLIADMLLHFRTILLDLYMIPPRRKLRVVRR